MKASREAFELIKRFESFRSKPYMCPGGQLTIGWGTTTGVIPNMEVSIGQADELLRQDVIEIDQALAQMIRVPLMQHQWDALVSLIYNIGEGSFEMSTLRKIINRGEFDRVPAEIKRWRRAGGQVLPGLAVRRSAEAALWQGRQLPPVPPLTPHLNFAREAVEQPARAWRISVPLKDVVNWFWRQLGGG
jgi:lysozyme